MGLWRILSFAHKSSLDYLVIMYFVSWYSEMSGKDLVRMLMHFVCMFALLKTKTKTKKTCRCVVLFVLERERLVLRLIWGTRMCFRLILYNYLYVLSSTISAQEGGDSEPDV